jgi:hypothetical protein
MSIFADFSSALLQAVSGCAFNVILVGALATVRGHVAWPLSFVVIGIGLGLAVGTFGILSFQAGRRLQGEAAQESSPS